MVEKKSFSSAGTDWSQDQRKPAAGKSKIDPWKGELVPDIKRRSRQISKPDFIKKWYGQDSSSGPDKYDRVQARVNAFNSFLKEIVDDKKCFEILK